MNTFEDAKAAALAMFKDRIGQGWIWQVYPYYDLNHQLLFCRARLDPPDGCNETKYIRPLSYEAGEWRPKEPVCLDGKPLFRLPQAIRYPMADLWIVEGEKCVDALADYGLVVTTSGSSTSAKHADWQPVVGARQRFIIWPDNDAAGVRYAREVTEQLQALGCQVLWVDIGQLNLPPGGDCVDWLAANPEATISEIQQLLLITPVMDAETPANQTMPKSQPTPASAVAIDLSKAVLDFPALLSASIPEPQGILPWLRHGSIVMIFASRGDGKSMMGQSIAQCVTSGEPFLKWNVENPCGVLYVDGEMSLSDYRDRLKKFARQPPVCPLLTLSHQTFYERFERDMDITDTATQAALLALLDEMPEIRLVIIDNLSSLTHIREDKSDDWRQYVQPFLLQCRRRNVAVLLIHHAGKSGEQRGTGAREDLLDASIKLTRPEGTAREEGVCVKFEFTKARSCYGDTIEPFIARLAATEEGYFEWQLSNLADSTKARLVGLIRDCGEDGITVTEAAEALGIHYSLVSRLKKELESEGVIKPADRKQPLIFANPHQH